MPPAKQPAPRLTLEAIFDSHTFDEVTLRQPHWMKDNVRFSFIDKFPGAQTDVLWMHDTRDGARTPLMKPDDLRPAGADRPVPIAGCTWSPDERSILLYEKAPTRFSSCGNLSLFDLATSETRPITDTEQPQRNAHFSPDGSRIGVVRADDLYVIALDTGAVTRLTHDASATTYNGRLGWVYEEELGLTDGWAWSPDGSAIGFLQQDESAAPEVLLSQYEELHADPLRTRYPKAGDPNPLVRIGIVDTTSGAILWVDLTDPGHGIPPGEHYVAALQWSPDGAGLLVQRLPRRQSRLDLLFIDARTGSSRLLVTEQDDRWVDPAGRLRFAEGDTAFLWPSERTGYRHYYLCSLTGESIRPITSGDYDVEEICALNAAERLVTYVAATPRPVDRTLWSVSLDGGERQPIADAPGRHTALFSGDGALFIHTHSTADRPASVALRTSDGVLKQQLIDRPIAALDQYGFGGTPTRRRPRPRWQFTTIPGADGAELWARILTPTRKPPARGFPALIYTYGGPGSQVALDVWNGKRDLWHHLLVDMGVVVAMIDNRGTGARGVDFRKQTFRRLGQLEAADQIAAARYLAGLPHIDAARLGIWGWSYGGYMTCLSLALGGDVFRAGIAVAAVTDWTLYDTIYTERYMERPIDNPDGYRQGSPVTHAAGVAARLLLCHGTMDDNVHFQNCARFAAALQDAKIQFDAMFYPGKRHGIEDRTYHLYRLMTDFLRRNLLA